MMRRILLALLLFSACAFGQVTTNSSITGVAGLSSTAAITSGTISGTTITTSTYNGNTLTTGSSTYTGTAAQTYTFPTTSATIARTDAANVFTGANSISTTLAVGGVTLNSSPAAGLQFNGSSANFFIRTNGAEAYFTGASNFFGCLNSGCVLNLTSGAASTALTLSGTGAVAMPGIASGSGATTGTLCWTTSTGNVTVNATVACLASARRFKQAIIPLDAGLTTLLQLRPVSYELKPEYDPDHLGRQVGLIAEEVASVDRRLVQYAPDGQAQGVRYMQMTAVLIKAIQEQQKQINHLKRTINSLSKGKP